LFTWWHASPLSAAENVLPSVHIAQTRSAALVPGSDMPSPAGQVLHAAQLARSAVDVNCPCGHAWQTRALVRVASATVNSPAAHGGPTSAHVVRSSEDEKVASNLHGLHTMSLMPLPATDNPSPTGHVCHAVHALSPGLAVNWPVGHAAHTKSLVAVAAVLV